LTNPDALGKLGNNREGELAIGNNRDPISPERKFTLRIHSEKVQSKSVVFEGVLRFTPHTKLSVVFLIIKIVSLFVHIQVAPIRSVTIPKSYNSEASSKAKAPEQRAANIQSAADTITFLFLDLMFIMVVCSSISVYR
jgi:hypothetical protein